MRIIAGDWRGRRIEAPAGRETRPTSDRAREGLFSMLLSRLGSFEGLEVADLFAGTGALGLEALSRGARYCDFVENGPSALHSLKANVAALRLREKTRIYDRDAIPFVERLQADRYDITFADPPYGEGFAETLSRLYLERPFAGMLWVEHRKNDPVAASESGSSGTYIRIFRCTSSDCSRWPFSVRMRASSLSSSSRPSAPAQRCGPNASRPFSFPICGVVTRNGPEPDKALCRLRQCRGSGRVDRLPARRTPPRDDDRGHRRVRQRQPSPGTGLRGL